MLFFLSLIFNKLLQLNKQTKKIFEPSVRRKFLMQLELQRKKLHFLFLQIKYSIPALPQFAKKGILLSTFSFDSSPGMIEMEKLLTRNTMHNGKNICLRNSVSQNVIIVSGNENDSLDKTCGCALGMSYMLCLQNHLKAFTQIA